MAGAVKNDFTKGAVWKVILRMALPMAAAQLVNVLYNVVDRMYIGHLPEVGSIALTGLGITMPIISFISAFANLCGMGGGPLCSIARGEGKFEYAEKIMANAFLMLLVIGAVLMGVCLGFLEKLIYLFGGSEATYPYASAYAAIYIAGTLFVMISLGMNSFINAQGFAATSMLTVIVGAVVNIGLDYLFVMKLNMGIQGAAIATVIAQACSAAWVLVFLTGKKAILRLRLKYMVPDFKIIGRILALGVTGFVMSATNSLVQIACNVQLKTYGGDLYVGAMTVINSVREVVFMIVHGLNNGAQPVIGYNYGAKAYSRVKSGIKFVTISSGTYALVIWTIVMLIPRTLAMIFNRDAQMLALCESAMRIYFCGFVIMSMQVAGQCVFVGLGKSPQAVFFSLLRKVIVVVPLTLLLPGWGLGANGVFWAEPISDLIGGAACFLTMYFTVYRRLNVPDGQPLPGRTAKKSAE